MVTSFDVDDVCVFGFEGGGLVGEGEKFLPTILGGSWAFVTLRQQHTAR